MIQFGMPTLVETKNITECASLCRELELQFIELNMNLPQYQPDHIDAAVLFDIAKQYGIYYTIHLDENLNVCDFNPLVKSAYLETVMQTIELARKLQSPVINMHLNHGVYFSMPNEKIYLFDAYLDKYLDSMLAFRDACEKATAGSGIRFCIENTDGHDHMFARKALQLLLESDAFALTFDIGHNHCIGGSDEAIIMQYENKLCHMHMHDAMGEKCHLALGTGDIDLGKYFNIARKNNLRIVLETKTKEGLRKSAAYVNTPGK